MAVPGGPRSLPRTPYNLHHVTVSSPQIFVSGIPHILYLRSLSGSAQLAETKGTGYGHVPRKRNQFLPTETCLRAVLHLSYRISALN